MPPAPPLPPVSENHEGNQAKTAGGISNTGGTMPRVEKMPPVENIQNYAQKSENGGTGATGGILNISPDQELLQYNNNNRVQMIEQKTQACSPSQEQINNVAIFRSGHSDTFACRYCKQRGDKWYMQKHYCQRLKCE